jgi:hypothetical protein
MADAGSNKEDSTFEMNSSLSTILVSSTVLLALAIVI